MVKISTEEDPVYPEDWPVYMARQCKLKDKFGRIIPGYRPPDEAMIKTGHIRAKYHFRLAHRKDEWAVEDFGVGVKDRRGKVLDPRAGDGFNIQFDGDNRYEFKNYGKKTALVSTHNRDMWGWKTFWDEIGRFDPVALNKKLVEKMTNPANGGGLHRVDKRRVPLVPYSHPGLKCPVGGDSALVGEYYLLYDGSILTWSCLICQLLGKMDCQMRLTRVLPVCSGNPDCGHAQWEYPDNLVTPGDDPEFAAAFPPASFMTGDSIYKLLKHIANVASTKDKPMLSATAMWLSSAGLRPRSGSHSHI